MREADLDRVREWRNEPKVRLNMYTSHVITPEEHRAWFEAASRDPSRRLLVCADENDEPVGVVTFSEVNSAQGTAVWSIFVDPTTRKGIGSEMAPLALDYAFGELGLEKLNAEVLGFNVPAIDFHRKHGFQVEGIFRAHYLRDGKRHDVYRLAHFRKVWLEPEASRS